MISYRESGVNIDEGNALVSKLKPLVKRTFDKNVIGEIGSFAGAYELPKGYKEPVLLGATDGVGTKLRLAIDSNRLETIGIDLVAMCVNDLICNGAEPLFFLDYYACGKLVKEQALRVIEGIVRGCEIAQCALIGGESAEMPNMYNKDDFDLAGFSVGIAEKEVVESFGKDVKESDILIALPSSGLHSNGFSLARKVLFEELKLPFDYDVNGRPLIDVLLEPTKIYVPFFKKHKTYIKSLAHITGGGIIENLPRALPNGLGAKISKKSLKILDIYPIMEKCVSQEECFRIFNMGVGMIVVTSKESAKHILQDEGYIIGEVIKGSTINIK